MLQQSIQQLRTLKLTGMAQALELQESQPGTYDDICFEERIGIIINQEMTSRTNKRLQRLLKAARFKDETRGEDIDYTHPRGLKKSQMATLLTTEWITKNHNIVLTGPTGCGKTYLACAIGYQACLHNYTVRYYRSSRLFESLTLAHGDGSYLKLISQLARVDLLILDDWGQVKLTLSQRNDLLEIMDDRHGSTSTIVTSQLPTTKWHTAIGDATLADAILDRLIHNAYKLKLKGESMRKNRAKLIN
ncbi:MAG: IS21-like element helper ATPase IstB [Flavobacteriales bacterium]|nr:IS21-like element helper ATPase IstB [Flavobacteriales bacterium]